MNSLLQAFKIPELRHKILMLMFFLAIFRVMAAVPIPGVDLLRLQQFFSSNELFGFLNIFSGGGLANLSIVMLGVGPFITAVIIMQLLTLIFPQLKKIYYEEGAEGRAKFNRYSRYLTVPLAAIQSYGFLNLLIYQHLIDTPGLGALLTNVSVITAVSVFVMWLGELISEYKIGNGISIIIFAGIVAGLPQIVTTSLASLCSTITGEQ